MISKQWANEHPEHYVRLGKMAKDLWYELRAVLSPIGVGMVWSPCHGPPRRGRLHVGHGDRLRRCRGPRRGLDQDKHVLVPFAPPRGPLLGLQVRGVAGDAPHDCLKTPVGFGIRFMPIQAPTILPAVAAVQSLSIPIATVSPITLVKFFPPIVIPHTVRQALFIV